MNSVLPLEATPKESLYLPRILTGRVSPWLFRKAFSSLMPCLRKCFRLQFLFLLNGFSPPFLHFPPVLFRCLIFFPRFGSHTLWYGPFLGNMHVQCPKSGKALVELLQKLETVIADPPPLSPLLRRSRPPSRSLFPCFVWFPCFSPSPLLSPYLVLTPAVVLSP